MTLSEELQWRGFVNQTTLNDITLLDRKTLTFYFGVDPSAPSMTVGNLAAAMMVRKFIKHKHKAVLLVGGATGLIGDPDGKAQERLLKPQAEIITNKKALIRQYKSLFDDLKFTVVDNHEWFKHISYLQFLRDIGKHVPMRQMLGRDFVQARLREGGAGISYAEFSYVLIQAYDFLHLFRKYGVTLQVAASDQWGNSVAGVDLIRRLTGQEAHVWTAPLVINRTTGKKFGKSEEGAVWLDPNLTSVYKFYQFWFNTDDEIVESYLKIFTELNKEAVENLMTEFQSNRNARLAQKRLAYEVTKLVHGENRARSVRRVSEALFSGDYHAIEKKDIEVLEQELPTVEVPSSSDLTEMLVKSGLAQSNSEARRFLKQGAVYVNGRPVTFTFSARSEDLLLGRYLIVRRGKNVHALLKYR